ncbi:nicolin-1-like isoform X2 [Argiope bruennichi]|uniref:Nicolin-1 like protein n=1 Tax=Argiope bruennichi TaxID=94029 RepID=A0A8T0FYJ7_ARGBR|nr:nicolin-1-like isoform X2 [Argiope bruennichi]KAF8796184.1 Nicolin-1 like protein [Argiope bruennichi]
MLISDDRKPLDFKAKAPVSIFLDDERADYKPGCCILEILFPEPVTIGDIRFRNNYTAFIGVSCKKVAAEKDVKNRDILPWQASVKRFILMQDPDCEKNSQDIVSIPAKESCIPLVGVVNVRFVLKQPSFRWKKFGIEELAFYGEITAKDVKQISITRPLSAASRLSECKTSIPDIDKSENVISSKARYMWTISELMRDKQATGSAVGRFEVDGSYDIGHLI